MTESQHEQSPKDAPAAKAKPSDIVRAFGAKYQGQTCIVDGGSGPIRVVTVGCRISNDRPILVVHYEAAEPVKNPVILQRTFTYQNSGYVVELTSHAADVQAYTEDEPTS